MPTIRVTAMLCITVLIIAAGYLVHSHSQDRYLVFPQQNNAMFVFDRQTTALNYCTTDSCRLVMPYGNESAPGASYLDSSYAMTGMPVPGFQPYVNPALESGAQGMVDTSMGANIKPNPMMMPQHIMWMQMQAMNSHKSQSKAGFSSLQSRPNTMNFMQMMQSSMQPNKKGKTVKAQSAIMPKAMDTSMKKDATKATKTSKLEDTSYEPAEEEYLEDTSYSEAEPAASESFESEEEYPEEEY